MSHKRQFSAIGLAIVGLFVLCYGIGLGSVGFAVIGLVIGLLGPGALIVSAVRANSLEYIFGEAQVLSASPPPPSGTVGRCEMRLSVFAHDVDGVVVRVRESAVPVSKWPDEGAMLPVEVASRNPRKVRVLWDRVTTHAQAASAERYPPYDDDGGDGYAAVDFEPLGYASDTAYPPDGSAFPALPAQRAANMDETPGREEFVDTGDTPKLGAASVATPHAGVSPDEPDGNDNDGRAIDDNDLERVVETTEPVEPLKTAEPAIATETAETGTPAQRPAEVADAGQTPAPDSIHSTDGTDGTDVGGTGRNAAASVMARVPGDVPHRRPSPRPGQRSGKRPGPRPRRPAEDHPVETPTAAENPAGFENPAAIENPAAPEPVKTAAINPVYVTAAEDEAPTDPPPEWPLTVSGEDVPERPESRPEPTDVEMVKGSLETGGDATPGGSTTEDTAHGEVISGTIMEPYPYRHRPAAMVWDTSHDLGRPLDVPPPPLDGFVARHADPYRSTDDPPRRYASGGRFSSGPSPSRRPAGSRRRDASQRPSDTGPIIDMPADQISFRDDPTYSDEIPYFSREPYAALNMGRDLDTSADRERLEALDQIDVPEWLITAPPTETSPAETSPLEPPSAVTVPSDQESPYAGSGPDDRQREPVPDEPRPSAPTAENIAPPAADIAQVTPATDEPEPFPPTTEENHQIPPPAPATEPEPTPEPEPEPTPEPALAALESDSHTAAPATDDSTLDSPDDPSVTLLARDIERSVTFYRDLLGLSQIDGGDDYAMFARGEKRILIREVLDREPVNRHTIHLTLEVEDIQTAYDELNANGVDFVHGPRLISQGEQFDLWTAKFRDPDGHGIAITHWHPHR